MTSITSVGLDLAMSVFQVHGADRDGRPVVRKKLRRAQVLKFFAELPACLVGMETCASAHHWARELEALGHEVWLIPPQFVKPFVKTNKNDPLVCRFRAAGGIARSFELDAYPPALGRGPVQADL